MRHPFQAVFLTCVLIGSLQPSLFSSSPPGSDITTIILVRHAERDTLQVDPPISVAGRERAMVLATMLANAGIRAIYTTDYLRTQQTVEPLASMLRLKPEAVVAEGRDLNEHVADLLGRIAAGGNEGVVLVSSHSNVIPVILRILGVDFNEEIPMHQYDDLFIITKQSGEPGRLLRLKFGKRTP